MTGITTKQIRTLKVLRDRDLVIASFDNDELSWLERYGFAKSTNAYAPNGKLARSKSWTITERGLCFLTEERAGQ